MHKLPKSKYKISKRRRSSKSTRSREFEITAACSGRSFNEEISMVEKGEEVHCIRTETDESYKLWKTTRCNYRCGLPSKNNKAANTIALGIECRFLAAIRRERGGEEEIECTNGREESARPLLFCIDIVEWTTSGLLIPTRAYDLCPQLDEKNRGKRIDRKSCKNDVVK